MLSIAGGVLISRPMLRRIDAINQTSREIMAGAFDRRIPARGTDDEFDRLATNLNDMLDRIAQLVASVREVSDNIAHDLRSPLARLRGRLELALAEQGGEDAYRRAIGRTIEEADALLKTFNSLLRIARLEAGVETGQIDSFDLDGLVNDVAELYAPLAEERQVALAAQPGQAGRIRGDRDLLFQALANLLDNAIKFAPGGGSVAIAAQGLGERVAVTVSDNGPGDSGRAQGPRGRTLLPCGGLAQRARRGARAQPGRRRRRAPWRRSRARGQRSGPPCGDDPAARAPARRRPCRLRPAGPYPTRRRLTGRSPGARGARRKSNAPRSQGGGPQ